MRREDSYAHLLPFSTFDAFEIVECKIFSKKIKNLKNVPIFPWICNIPFDRSLDLNFSVKTPLFRYRANIFRQILTHILLDNFFVVNTIFPPQFLCTTENIDYPLNISSLMTLFVSGKLLWTEEEACLLGLHWFTFYTKINTVCQMGIWRILYPKLV